MPRWLLVKSPPANAGGTGDSGLIPGLGYTLEEEMAIHSRFLAGTIPWTEEPGGLQSEGLQSQTQLSTRACHHYVQSPVLQGRGTE